MGHEHDDHGSPAEAFMHKQMGVEGGLNMAHTVAEAVMHGGHSLSHVAHAPPGALTGVGGVLAPLTIFNGGYEMASGVSRIANGEADEGSLDVLQGLGSVVEGGGTLATLAGVSGAGAVAPIAGAAVGGLKLGRFGDSEAARLGILGQDEKGKNRSISDWGADGGVDEYAKTKHDTYQFLQKYLPQRVADIGSEVAGHGAGLSSTLGHSIAGVPLAIGSAAVGGAERGWSALKGLFGGGEKHEGGH